MRNTPIALLSLLLSTPLIATAGESVSLFNGTDLAGWHTDIPDADGGAEISPSFIVREGMLVSLGSPQGHLITDAVYQDYRLVVEYRWTKKPGNCGVLVHASTPRRLYKMFPSSIECQMYVGNAGDFWCIGEDIAVENMVRQRGAKEKWGVDEGRARRIRNVTDDSESPVGEWNQMVIECRGRTIDVWVNGDHVNHGFGCTVDRGQIAIQAEGAEAEFRRVELTQLGLPATTPMPRSTETAQVFASGIVSTEANEFATSFSPDGKSVYFSRSSDGQIQIYRSNWNDGWGIATPLEWSSGSRDMDPFVSPRGDLLFFASNRESEPPAEPGFDLWMSPRTKVAGTEAGWGPPMRMASPPNTSGMDAFMSVSARGTLFFDSKAIPNGVRRIYRSNWSAGEYGPSEEIDLGLPEGVAVGNPLVLPNERALIFASRGLGGAGGADLFISYCAADGSWSEPTALPGSINSPSEEYAPGLGADGHTLFFTSTRGSEVDETTDRRPPGDIYFVRLPTTR